MARTYAEAEDFEQLPVSTRGSAALIGTGTQSGNAAAAGYVTRLGDIARVEEAPQEDRRLFRGNGVDQIGLAVTRQAQSNDLAISEGCARPDRRAWSELAVRPAWRGGCGRFKAGHFDRERRVTPRFIRIAIRRK